MRFSTVIPLLMSVSASLANPTPVDNSTPACQVGASNPSRTVAAFHKAGIVPTLIPSIDPKLDARFSFNKKNVDLGTTFTTLETAGLGPDFEITKEKNQPASTTYSVFLVDPDVPSPDGAPVAGVRINYLHWYVHGVQPCTPSSGAAALANTVTAYEAPTPLSPRVQHRYTFLVYREPAGYRPAVIPAQVRPTFQINDYANKGQLVLVGGNYFNQSITDGVVPPSSS